MIDQILYFGPTPILISESEIGVVKCENTELNLSNAPVEINFIKAIILNSRFGNVQKILHN
jgi:hypothetical protein